MSDIRKLIDIVTETTVSGAIATGGFAPYAKNVGETIKRTEESDDAKDVQKKFLEYGNWANSALATSEKMSSKRKHEPKVVKSIYGEDTKKVNESADPKKIITQEEKIDEHDLIVNPAMLSKMARDIIPKDHSRVDHEVEMAKADLFHAGEDAAKIFNMIRDVSEMEGLEGWVQEKIIKAADYLRIVKDYLEGKRFAESKIYWDSDRPAEPWHTIDKLAESIDGTGPSTRMFTSEEHGEGATFKNGLHTIIRVASHLDKVLQDSDDLPEWVSEKMGAAKSMIVAIMNHVISDKEQHAEKHAGVEGLTMTEGVQSCPECGGQMYPEEMINEKKDACYYKVKSRYKVWPSAYASGALVKCRKAGAKNWGTKSEGVMEGISIVDQDYDLDQQIFTFNVDGKEVKFTYWDYDEDWSNPDIDEIKAQVEKRLTELSKAQQKAVTNAVYHAVKQSVAEEHDLSEISDETKASYREKALGQIKDLEQHAEHGEYKDIAQNIIDRRKKGIQKSQGVTESDEVSEFKKFTDRIVKPNAS